MGFPLETSTGDMNQVTTPSPTIGHNVPRASKRPANPIMVTWNSKHSPTPLQQHPCPLIGLTKGSTRVGRFPIQLAQKGTGWRRWYLRGHHQRWDLITPEPRTQTRGSGIQPRENRNAKRSNLPRKNVETLRLKNIFR